MEYIIRVRALIKHNWKMFLVKNNGRDFYCLPGWKHEWDENMKDTLKRELKEELFVDAEIWELITINEYLKDDKYNLDLVFDVINSEDFLNFNLEKATHSFELSNAWFFDINDKNLILKPSNLTEI